MGIQEIIAGKKQWRELMARVDALPHDYQVVYHEIQKYVFKAGPADANEGIDLLAGIIGLFEEGAAAGKPVLDVTGRDVAGFCDGLIEGSVTHADIYQESVNQSVAAAINKATQRGK